MVRGVGQFDPCSLRFFDVSDKLADVVTYSLICGFLKGTIF